jgi:cyanophycinase-like exopeptidase
MTGGDQLRLCGLLADTPLMEKVRQRVQQGEITLAGTSAGAAVMGHHMIAGRRQWGITESFLSGHGNGTRDYPRGDCGSTFSQS